MVQQTPPGVFSFERYNGILGKMPNNNHSLEIEKTMATRFIHQLQSKSSFPHFASELEEFFPSNVVGSVKDTIVNSDVYVKLYELSKTNFLPDLIFHSKVT